MNRRPRAERITVPLRALVAILLLLSVLSGFAACGTDDLTVPGSPAPTIPVATATPDDSDEDEDF